MLSENLRTIAGYLGQMQDIRVESYHPEDMTLEEIDEFSNMSFALGWAIGAIFKEASKVEKEGR